jgi:hypothetical protein
MEHPSPERAIPGIIRNESCIWNFWNNNWALLSPDTILTRFSSLDEILWTG